ncbi:MAG: hydroxyethylthiazole kinase [Candidatus Cloacimonas sp. 4484_140]|nr:MAG: hydroxyethylthiazole kinase [Candidatus Cloacimonas sp. 4484_140]
MKFEKYKKSSRNIIRNEDIMQELHLPLYTYLQKIRNTNPLIHHITNWVSIADCANIVRLTGGLPIMAHAKEEVADMVKLSDALVLNIGTLTTELVESMKIAAKAANKKGIPVVLDAVGVGATPFRDKKAFELLDECHINIIKGNASEIAKLAGEDVVTKGVEAVDVQLDLVKVAKKLAKERNAGVVITAPEDIVAWKEDVYVVKNGHPLMGQIVGTGCMAASVLGCFCAIDKDYGKVCAAGLSVYEIAAEKAASETFTPFAFKQKFFDELFKMDEVCDWMQKIIAL